MLGERDGDSDILRDAVAACRAALDVYTREATPLEWAMASTNLANALVALAETEAATRIWKKPSPSIARRWPRSMVPERIQQRAIARYNLKRAEQRLSALRG